MLGYSYPTADACSCMVRSWPYYSHILLLIALFVANSLTKLSVSYTACRDCDQGLMMCINRLDGSCCNFYRDNQCVEQCLPPMAGVDSNFSCSEWWRLLSPPISYKISLIDKTIIYKDNASKLCDGYVQLTSIRQHRFMALAEGVCMYLCVVYGRTINYWTIRHFASLLWPLVLDCGDLMNPANGEVDLNGTTPDSVATYSCDMGFRLNGTSTRTCQMSAQWSGSAPTCDRKYIWV